MCVLSAEHRDENDAEQQSASDRADRIGRVHGADDTTGIVAIELGVLLTVAATMVTVFYGFAGRMADATRAEGRR